MASELQNLPKEILIKIIFELDTVSIGNLSETNKTFNSLINEKYISESHHLKLKFITLLFKLTFYFDYHIGNLNFFLSTYKIKKFKKFQKLIYELKNVIINSQNLFCQIRNKDKEAGLKFLLKTYKSNYFLHVINKLKSKVRVLSKFARFKVLKDYLSCPKRKWKFIFNSFQFSIEIQTLEDQRVQTKYNKILTKELVSLFTSVGFTFKHYPRIDGRSDWIIEGCTLNTDNLYERRDMQHSAKYKDVFFLIKCHGPIKKTIKTRNNNWSFESFVSFVFRTPKLNILKSNIFLFRN